MTVVWVTHRFVGFHCWPDAPEHRAYLRSPHRHCFPVKTGIEVEHDDREVEFHDLLAVVAQACDKLESGTGSWPMTGTESCEQIANKVLDQVELRWPGRLIFCEVSEDGECGAWVEREPSV